MSGEHGELLDARGPVQEPAGFWGFDDELESAVGEGSETHLEGDVAVDVPRYLVELLAEFHHVDAEGTQGLTHLRVGLGHARVDAQVHLRCGETCVPRTIDIDFN